MIVALAGAVVALGQDAPTCTRTSLGKVADGPTPGVWVLGERKGTLPDLARAKRIVKKLLKRGPVTLALQAVPLAEQTVLDDLSTGRVTMDQLPTVLDWENTWGFPFEAYEPLLGLGPDGVHLLAIGAPYGLRPQDQPVQLPPAYFSILADPMGDNPVPPELETPFAEFVAWADHEFASRAISRWDGQGALVIVVDRFHVEGGLGVQWQAQRLTPAPVKSAVLADAGSRCYPGDLLLH